MKMKNKKEKKQVEQISQNGFYLILAGVVFSIIFNTNVINVPFEPLKWLGFLLMVAGMVMVMIPVLRDRKKRRAEKQKNQNL